ncbi:MAG TPA: hypothetical protein VKV57_02250 [bacterium]|nr:hypothetical protein [bacterium]
MTVDQLVGGMTLIRKRIRAINARYDGLENQNEAMNVVQAALHEMSILHELLPADLKGKSWVFLSLERARVPWRSSSN